MATRRSRDAPLPAVGMMLARVLDGRKECNAAPMRPGEVATASGHHKSSYHRGDICELSYWF